MNENEIAVINRVITLLRTLTVEPRDSGTTPSQCPVALFAKQFLVNDPEDDVSCSELWTFYREIADARELPPMRETVFLRQLPTVMQTVFNAKKSHAIERVGRRVRGFRGVTIKLDA
jgi:hypothetical protein